MHLAAGTTIEHRYVVEGPLGSGGMASVYSARDTKLDVDVAVKVLSISTPGFRERLLKEGRVQAALRHPNIVNVSDIVSVSGFPALIMERIRGAPLDRLISVRRLAPNEAEHLARGVLDGLRAAHEHGVVHRDLKPANVLVSHTGDRLLPKVADFGIVKMIDEEDSKTRSGASMGTPRYSSPEQVRDAKDVDARADLWSFGALLYELVCGRPAFVGADTYEIYNAVVEGRYLPAEEAPERLRAVIDACLTVDREARPRSAEAVQAMFGPAPAEDWHPETLQCVDTLGAAATAHQPGVTAAETWADASLAADQAAETFLVDPSDPTVAPAPTSGMRWGVGLGLLAVLALGGGLVALQLPPDTPEVFTAEGPPPVSSHEALMASAWHALETEDGVRTEEIARRLFDEEVAEPALYLVTAAASLHFHDADAYQELVERGASLAEPGRSGVDDLLLRLEEHREDRNPDWWEPSLREHLEHHPEDWLARVLLAVAAGISPQEITLDERFLIELRDRNPDAPIGETLWISWVYRNAPERELEAIEEALTRHPGHGPFHARRAWAILGDDPEGALKSAQICLARSGRDRCRVVGVHAALRLDDEEAYAALMEPLWGKPDRVWLDIYGVAVAHQAHGRFSVADRIWERALRAARETGDSVVVKVCQQAAFSQSAPWLRRAGVLEEWLPVLNDALLSNDVNADLAAWAKPSVAVLNALVAIDHGELDRARAHRDKLQGLHHTMVDDALHHHLGQWEPLRKTPERDSGLVPMLLARAWYLVDGGEDAAARTHLDAVDIEADPSSRWSDRAVFHALDGVLAERSGHDDAAAAAVGRLREVWSRPDPDVPPIRLVAAEITPDLFQPGALSRWLERQDPVRLEVAPWNTSGAAADRANGLQPLLADLVPPSEEGPTVRVHPTLEDVDGEAVLTLTATEGAHEGSASLPLSGGEPLDRAVEGALLIALSELLDDPR